jgi:hypothetical protein
MPLNYWRIVSRFIVEERAVSQRYWYDAVFVMERVETPPHDDIEREFAARHPHFTHIRMGNASVTPITAEQAHFLLI